MNDRTTETFVALMKATFEASPSAPELPTMPDRRPAVLRRPAAAVAAGFAVVVLLVGGLTVVANLATGDSRAWSPPAAGQPAVGIDDYWEWATTDAAVVTDLTVAVTRGGPEPAFDPATLGTVQTLQRVDRRIDVGGLDPPPVVPVALIGSVAGGETEAFMYRTGDGADRQLVLCITDGNDGTACAASATPVSVGGEGSYWLVFTSGTSDRGSATRIGLAMLPDTASVVTFTLSTGQVIVQKPVGGAAVVEIPGNHPTAEGITVAVLDAQGGVLTKTDF